jgi:O-antigen ligase
MGVGSIALGLFTSVSILSLFHIFTVIPFLLIFWEAIKSDNSFPMSSKFIIALILWALISNFYNFHILTEPLNSFGKIKYLLFAFLSVFGFQFWLKNVSTQSLKNIFKILFFTIVLATFYGYIKHFHNFDLLKWQNVVPDDGRRIGGFTGVMRYGYGMSLVITILLGIYFQFDKFKNYFSKKILVCVILTSLAGLYFSYTRGALVGFLISLPIILYYYKKNLAIFSLIGISLILVTIIIISINGGSKSSRYLLSLNAGTNTKRLSQYQSAIYAIKDAPLFGLGMKQFSHEVPKIKEKYNLEHKNYSSHSHNIFLEIGASSGILGIIFFTLWIISWIRELFIIGGISKIIVIPFITNFIISGQFEYTLDANNSLLIFSVYALSLYSYQGQIDEYYSA